MFPGALAARPRNSKCGKLFTTREEHLPLERRILATSSVAGILTHNNYHSVYLWLARVCNTRWRSRRADLPSTASQRAVSCQLARSPRRSKDRDSTCTPGGSLHLDTLRSCARLSSDLLVPLLPRIWLPPDSATILSLCLLMEAAEELMRPVRGCCYSQSACAVY